jgi:hypothetical protein
MRRGRLSPRREGRREPLRYIAIRIQKKQGDLFAGGSRAKHDAVNNEFAAGVLPCGRFGANAAWLRLAALTHNVLTAMKRLALPPELLRARPKRLRFLVFAQPDKFVRHARQLKLRLLRAWRRFSSWAWAFGKLPLAARSGAVSWVGPRPLTAARRRCASFRPPTPACAPPLRSPARRAPPPPSPYGRITA